MYSGVYCGCNIGSCDRKTLLRLQAQDIDSLGCVLTVIRPRDMHIEVLNLFTIKLRNCLCIEQCVVVLRIVIFDTIHCNGYIP